MIDALSTILKPIILLMDWIFSFYQQATNSPGLSLILLAMTSAIIVIPLQQFGRKVERRLCDKIRMIEKELAPYKRRLKGEDLFHKMEEIYRSYNYHPIHSVGLGMSFIVVLPVLFSAIILLDAHPALEGKRWLFITDLSQPDQLLGPLNALPITMTLLAMVDATIRFRNDHAVLFRFLITALVLLALVYNFASAFMVYWITNVFVALSLTLLAPQATIQKNSVVTNF